MKVYRGFDKEVGPISYAHWTYVTPDIEQAKWYATKNGDVEDGAIIEWDLDVDNLRFISLDKLNSFAQSKSEIYSEEDLLWYQEGLGESLYKYIAGIYFTDPHYKDHIIYIVFNKDILKNGRILSPEEFDRVQLKESEQVSKSKTNILKNPTRYDLFKNNLVYTRYCFDRNNNYYFADDFDYTHNDIKLKLKKYGIEVSDDMGFYNAEDNCFYLRAYFDNEEDKNQFLTRETKQLKNNTRLKQLFGNFNVEVFSKEYPFDQLTESIEENTILKNPSKRDLERFKDVSQWRILQDLQGNYYFADALKYIHSRMERELISKGIEAVRADEDNYGITLYSIYDNTFYYRLLGIASLEDIENEYNNSYLSKAFPNANLRQSNDDIDDELDEAVYPKDKYVFPFPDWGNLNDVIDPNDDYRWWVDGVKAKIKHTYSKDIPVDKIYQDWDGDDISDYEYKDFDRGIDTPIEVLKYNNQYIIMDGHHRAAYAKLNGFPTIKATVYDTDSLRNNITEAVNKGIDFIAYHGGVEPDMTPQPNRALYLTDSYELAHQFARREIWNDGLYEGEIPTIFTFKGHFNNPYYMTLDEYNDEGQDSNIDIQKWIEMGVDGIVLPPNEEGSTTYYIVIDLSTIKLVDKKVFYDEADLDDDY